MSAARSTSWPSNVAISSLVAVAIFVIDQLSKYWVLEVLNLRERLRFESEWFALLNFALARNTGVNFGLFAGSGETQQYVLAAFATAISIALFVWSARSSDPRMGLAAGAIIGGALGNAVDRVTEGAVIDFLNFDCCGIGNPYAFNVADAAIFVGAVGLAILLWRDQPEGTSETDRS